MQVRNGDIWGGKEALASLLNEKLPVKTSYWITKLARKAGEQLRDIESVRRKLIEEHGEQGENGTMEIKPSSEHWSAFVTAYDELMAETVEIEGLPMEKIKLPSDNGLCLSPAQLMALDAFVEVE